MSDKSRRQFGNPECITLASLIQSLGTVKLFWYLCFISKVVSWEIAELCLTKGFSASAVYFLLSLYAIIAAHDHWTITIIIAISCITLFCNKRRNFEPLKRGAGYSNSTMRPRGQEKSASELRFIATSFPWKRKALGTRLSLVFRREKLNSSFPLNEDTLLKLENVSQPR